MQTSEHAHLDSAQRLVDEVKSARLPSPDERQRIRATARAPLRRMAAALGVTTTTLLRWERGEAEPRLAHAIAYRRLLDELDEATR